jgi:hypothetical protein
MKFNINDYKGKYVMHCKTEEEAKDFLAHLDSTGRKWNSDISYLTYTHWEDNQPDTVYYFNEGQCGSMNYAKRLNYTILEWEDFMNKEFTKADLKTGDVVQLRNGEIGIVNGDLGTIVMRDAFCNLKGFHDDLTREVFDTVAHDIVAVRRPESAYHCQFCAFEKKYGALVYERKEVEEMTLAEVCRLLGKEIKIVK